MDKRKNKLTYLISCAICVLLLVIGYFAATGSGDYYAPREGAYYYRARVEKVLNTSAEYGEDGNILSEDLLLSVRIKDGDRRGDTVIAKQNYSSYTPFNPAPAENGDSIIVANFGDEGEWFFIDFVRSDAIILLTLLFALLLVIFGRKKGVKTVFSLALTLMAVFFVFIPAVLSGGNVYFWSVAVCIYIIAMTLVITSGLSPMSLAATVGCAGGVLSSLLITFIADLFMNITGNADPHSIYLVNIGEGLDLKGLIYASVIIGCVGAVMDVAVDISASLKELAIKLKNSTMGELFRSGLNIGRDVIGTMSNTLVLAYIGGSMSSLLLYFYNNYANAVYLFNIEIIIVELLKIIVGSIGILLTLPLTALVSAWLYTREPMRKKLISESEPQDAEAADEFTLMLENAEAFDGETQRKD